MSASISNSKLGWSDRIFVVLLSLHANSRYSFAFSHSLIIFNRLLHILRVNNGSGNTAMPNGMFPVVLLSFIIRCHIVGATYSVLKLCTREILLSMATCIHITLLCHRCTSLLCGCMNQDGTRDLKFFGGTNIEPSLLRCYVLSNGKQLPTFGTGVVLPSSGSKSPKRCR